MLDIGCTLELHPVQSSIVATTLVWLHLRSESSDSLTDGRAFCGCPVSIKIMFQISPCKPISNIWFIGFSISVLESDSMCRHVIAATEYATVATFIRTL